MNGENDEPHGRGQEPTQTAGSPYGFFILFGARFPRLSFFHHFGSSLRAP